MGRVLPWALAAVLIGIGVAVAVLVVTRDEGGTALVVDYSPTLSDVPALLYVASRPDVDLLAVTLPGTGESSCAAGVQHTRQILKLTGLDDVPVGCGREEPLAGDRDWPESWREAADALPGLVLPFVPQAPAPDAVDVLAGAIAEADGPVTILTLGPLTNLGLLLRDRPEAAEGIGRIVTMGGAVDVEGNVEQEPAAEWNLYVDPEAMRVVLASGVPVTLVPLDATNDVPGNRILIARAQDADGTPAGVAVAQYWRANAGYVASEGFFHWDELAAAATLEPALVTEEPRTIAVDDRGATVDRPGGTEVTVATSADREAFEQNLLDVLNGSPLPPPPPLDDEELEYVETLARSFDAFNEALRGATGPPEAPRAERLEAARTFVTGIFGAVEALDETLASVSPPEKYAAAQEEMAAALEGLGALAPEAAATLESPEAAQAEQPFLVLLEVVGERFQTLGLQLNAACLEIADDVLVRGGPELACLPA